MGEYCIFSGVTYVIDCEEVISHPYPVDGALCCGGEIGMVMSMRKGEYDEAVGGTRRGPSTSKL